jgi:hypothetical protein
LLDQQAVGAQGAVAVAKNGSANKPFGRSDRIGAVHDDHVVTAGFRVFDPGETIIEAYCARGSGWRRTVRESSARRRASHFLVDVHLGRGFDAGMSEHFAQGAAIAAADDQHPLGVGVGEQRRMSHHLVVQKLSRLVSMM